VKEYESPYASLANNPIQLVDFNGADTTLPTAAGSGSVTLPGDVKNIQTYQQGYTYSLVSDLKKPVPVKGGELRSFSSRNGLGIFTARWEEGENGEVSFLGYKNGDNQTYNEAVEA
jgi:hypothetical protein